MASLKSLVLLCLLPLQALAAPTNGSPIPGYGIEELTWEVEVFPGQGVQSFTGTIETVQEQVLALNPEWEAPKVTVASNKTVAHKAHKRYDNWTRVSCSPQGWGPASPLATYWGREYLRSVKGNPPRNGPGLGNCGRVSCSYDSAIYWCNDNRYAKTLGSWSDIADGADRISKECRNSEGICGQAFAKDNFNVIVRKDRC